jgi:hypothetical protein
MRYSVSRTPGSLLFVIPSWVDRFFCWFFPLWLVGLVLLARHNPPKNLESYFTVSLFAVMALLMFYKWLWSLSGIEELSFNANTFTHRRVLFGISRARIFAMSEISGLRFVGLRRRGMGGGTPSGLGFLYRGKEIRVGDHLTQAEAKEIASAITREFPQYSSAWGPYDEGFPDSDKPVQLDLGKT